MSLQTREASTIAIVTFVASASLLFLTVQSHIVQISQIAPIGFMFSFLGLSYRQITAWTIDRIQYNRAVNMARIEITDILPDESDRGGLDLDTRYDDLAICDEHNRRAVQILHERNRWSTYLLWSIIREFLWTWLLSLPVALWALVWYNQLNSIIISNSYDVLTISMIIGVLLAEIHFFLRLRDWFQYH